MSRVRDPGTMGRGSAGPRKRTLTREGVMADRAAAHAMPASPERTEALRKVRERLKVIDKREGYA